MIKTIWLRITVLGTRRTYECDPGTGSDSSAPRSGIPPFELPEEIWERLRPGGDSREYRVLLPDSAAEESVVEKLVDRIAIGCQITNEDILVVSLKPLTPKPVACYWCQQAGQGLVYPVMHKWPSGKHAAKCAACGQQGPLSATAAEATRTWNAQQAV